MIKLRDMDVLRVDWAVPEQGFGPPSSYGAMDIWPVLGQSGEQIIVEPEIVLEDEFETSQVWKFSFDLSEAARLPNDSHITTLHTGPP
ncbi:hypothetical protein FBEOM_13699 [Fusarium beomiforme]|uniref:Uncharacterized protein n=1 Tax=Fusarium beomiforme TaxID=44412 RepID=A0A9P5DRV1_9HYPO|nr:hypothetical protein FBEOM_13699 [Fusarium beomiforme]